MVCACVFELSCLPHPFFELAYLLLILKEKSGGFTKVGNLVLRHGRDVHPMWVKSFTETLGSGFRVLSTRAKSEEDFDSY